MLVLLLFVFALFIYALMSAVGSFENDLEWLTLQSSANARFSYARLHLHMAVPLHKWWKKLACIGDGGQRGHCDTQYLRLSNTNTEK